MVTTSDFEIRNLEAGQVAFQQFRGTLPSIESVTSSVRSWVVTMGFRPEGPMAVEIHGVPTGATGEEFEMEVQLPVSGSAKAHPSDRVQIKPFEATRAVVMTVRGPCELAGLSEPLGRMQEWMKGQNLQPGPVVRWVEITDPAKVALDEQMTEIQYLLPQG